MSSGPSVVLSSIAAQAFIFLYGICRMVDGLDGTRGPGIAWNVGHTMFFLAFVLLAVLIAGLRRMASFTAPWQRVVANGAVVAGVTGSLPSSG